MHPWQPSLFGDQSPRIDATFGGMRRLELDASAWIDYCPQWLAGHTAVFESIRASTTWHAAERPMYDRVVSVPRLMAALPDDGPGHPVLERITAALSARYHPLSRISMAYYRDGRDSVAMHADRGPDLVAIVSLGAPRRFLVKPKAGGPSIRLPVGWGDLVVMGGTCQRDWLHGVPKSARPTGPRIAVMWR